MDKYCCESCSWNDQEAIKLRILALNMQAVSPDDLAWLHRMKNLATVMQGRLQLKYAKENEDYDATICNNT